MSRPSVPRTPLGWLAVVQVAVIVVAGAATAWRFQLFAEVDERGHYDYVQKIVEEGRLPWLGRDLISPETLAINDGTWPRPSRRRPEQIGFTGHSHEAFQPPLYYVVAAPAFAVVPDHRDKVFALRALGLAMLLATLGLVAALARAVFREGWLLPFCLATWLLMWPGVVARSVTVSNAALEVLLGVAFILACWRAADRPSPRRLLLAGALLGLCLLTKLTLVFLAPVLLVPARALLRRGG